MARDAITRQYDVDKNLVTLTCDEDKGGYRPGLITFPARAGKSIDLDKIRESLTATRLSGGTSMKMDWLEITATGEISGDKELMLKVSGSGEQFRLDESPTAKGMFQKLQAARANGAKITSVTGRVPGWKGTFPAVLKALANTPVEKRNQILVTAFEVAK
jgi:hypothetical protein